MHSVYMKGGEHRKIGGYCWSAKFDWACCFCELLSDLAIEKLYSSYRFRDRGGLQKDTDLLESGEY